jgi:phage-related protein
MGATTTLRFLLVAKNEASEALKKVGGDAKATGGHIGKMSTGAKVALAGIGVAALDFGKESIDKFREVSQETQTLQRSFGGTVADASRLRFAAGETGTGFEVFAKSTAKLSKTLYTASQSTKTNAQTIKILGFNYRDAHGHLLPMSELLPKVADRFSKMKAGTEKTAMAMTLFGKSGVSMLPFLNRGKTGIEDLMKESDKFGLTLTGKNLQAMQKAKEQSRQWHAAMEGLQVQIGAQLLPIMNKLIGFIQSYVIPVFKSATAFVQNHQSAMKVLGIAFGALTAILAIHKVAMIATSIATKVQAVATGIWTAAQWLLNAALEANPIALVVIGIAALTAGIIWVAEKTHFFQAAWHATWGAVKSVFSGVWNFIKDHWRLIVSILTGPIGAAVIYITSHWTAIKNGFMSVVHFISDKVGDIVGFITGIPRRVAGVAHALLNVGKNIAGGLWNGLKSIFSSMGSFGKSLYNAVVGSINWLIDKIKNWHFTIGAFGIHHTFQPFGGIPDIPMMAKGGVVTRPTLAMIGEAGAEAVVPLNKAHQYGFGGGGHGGDVYHITVSGVIGEAKEAAKVILTELQRLKGQGVKVNLA